MIIALPSGHEHVAAAFVAEGSTVVHCDQHVREHLLAIDPPICGEAVLVNRHSGPRLSQKLNEMSNRLALRARRSHESVEVHDDHRVTVAHHDDRGDQIVDLLDELAERHGELRRMVDAARRLLPPPEFGEGTIVVGVDSDAQARLLSSDVKVISITGKTPPWAVDRDLIELDAGLSPEAQAAAAIEAVRAPVPA